MMTKSHFNFRKALPESLKSRKGQTAVFLIFVIAIALIMFSASLNWARVAQVKSVVTIASNTMASGMASFMSSYGENQAQTQLGGRREICAKTMFLVMLLLVIIIVIIYPPILYSGLGMNPGTITIAAALAFTLAMQVMVIEPGLSRIWNKMQSNMPLPAQIIEGALQEGLVIAANDTETMFDHFDYDADGLWVDSSGISNSDAREDRIGRLSFYYTKRLQEFEPDKYPEIDEFKEGLSEFLYDDPFAKEDSQKDFFGLFDPGCTSTTPGSTPNPYCDSCCLPQMHNGKRLRPASCTPAQVAACGSGDYPVARYQWQHDPVYENYTNTFYSFREMLGVDDENSQFRRSETNPNSPPPQTPDLIGGFNPKDSTGWHASDSRKGVFPFFWKMSQLPLAAPTNAPSVPTLPKTDNIVMMTANPASCTPSSCPNTFMARPNQCAVDVGTDPATNLPRTNGFWWKPGADEYCSNVYPYNDCISYVGNCANEYAGASAPNCGCIASDDPTLWHDDNVDNLVYGLKHFLAYSLGFLKSDTEVLGKDFGSWYPSLAEWIAPKCSGAPNGWCYNGPTDGTLIVWRNMVGGWIDLLDTWLYRTSFANNSSWCMPTLATANNTYTYKELSSMPSQGEFNSPSTSNLTIARSGTINLTVRPYLSYVPGQNIVISANSTNYMAGKVVSYTVGTGEMSVQLESSVGAGAYSNWTVTNAVKDRNGNNIPSVWGDTNDVLACMAYNADNVAKLTACKTHCLANPTFYSCNAKYCLNLPRSVVNLGGSSANAAENTAYRTAQRLQDCLSSNCRNSTGGTLSVCQGLPGISQAPNCTNFAPGNPFFDAVRIERDHQFDLSNYCEPSGGPTRFQTNLDVAIAAAEAHAPVLTSRSLDLTDLRNGALNARNAFLGFYNNAGEFLKPCQPGVPLGGGCGNCTNGGPAAQMICARQRSLTARDGLENFVIYGWKSQPVAGRGALGTDPPTGYWHIVRAEAFAPQRCWNRCGTDKLPFVETRVFWRNIYRIRCYTLTETDGRVVARVTRWDEDRDSPGARLANGQPLWKFRFGKPGAAPITIGNTLDIDCKHHPDLDEGLSSSSKAAINGAFMINDHPADNPKTNPTCFNMVQQLLDRGVQTTTCARYYYDDTINHMNLKFTPCNQATVDYLTNCAQSQEGTCT